MKVSHDRIYLGIFGQIYYLDSILERVATVLCNAALVGAFGVVGWAIFQLVTRI